MLLQVQEGGKKSMLVPRLHGQDNTSGEMSNTPYNTGKVPAGRFSKVPINGQDLQFRVATDAPRLLRGGITTPLSTLDLRVMARHGHSRRGWTAPSPSTLTSARQNSSTRITHSHPFTHLQLPLLKRKFFSSDASLFPSQDRVPGNPSMPEYAGMPGHISGPRPLPGR